MKAGRFTEKMTVQRVETTIDQFGGETQTWTDRYLDVWCQPMPIGSSAAGGGEYNDDAQMQADAKYEFVCRYLPGVEYTDRIYWSGGYFDIYQIFPIGRREGMRIRGSWSDDQGDAWSMGGLNAEQVVSGTGGLTLSQVTAEYEANDTGQTFAELVTFYNDAHIGEPAKIFYPSFLHLDSWRYTSPDFDLSYPGGLDEKIIAGEMHAGPAPANILNVAAIDYTTPTLALKTLESDNAFGNRHRFTFDDGTEATEVYTNDPTTLDNAAFDNGYTGSNPRYIIDHYTGLGWYRSHHGFASQGEWYTWKGTNQGATPFDDYFGLLAEVDNMTLMGYSDWRLPSIQEMYGSLGSSDIVNWLGQPNSNENTDTYFPPINQYWRGYGGRNLLLGPFDFDNQNEGTSVPYNPYVATVTSNGALLSYQTLSTAEVLADSGSNWNVFLVRRHYDNR